MKIRVRTLRIHHEPENPSYDLYDRYGNWIKHIAYPIAVLDLPKVLYFGYCPIETEDVTLDFGREVTLNLFDSRKSYQQ